MSTSRFQLKAKNRFSGDVLTIGQEIGPKVFPADPDTNYDRISGLTQKKGQINENNKPFELQAHLPEQEWILTDIY